MAEKKKPTVAIVMGSKSDWPVLEFTYNTLKEFGVEIPADVDIAVHDSNADLRYVVMPMRPAGSEGLSEDELAALIGRDCVVGCALPREPGGAN